MPTHIISNDRKPLLSRNVLLIAFSAFFADMGYQVILAGFPYFLVFVIGAPYYLYGLAEGLNYGVGSLFAFAGGKLSDRYGNRKIAIIGNALIPVLSFTGFSSTAIEAISVRATGWWFRNLRSPARRSLYSQSVSRENRSRAFGLLHGLDVGGGLLATFILLGLLFYHWPFRYIFLVTALPITVSTLLIIMTKVPVQEKTEKVVETSREANTAVRGILASSALFGFSFYSLGFPILTVSQDTHSPLLGIFTYTLFMGVSSLAGLLYGRIEIKREIPALGILGYIMAGIGSLGFAMSIYFNMDFLYFYLFISIIGFSTGAIETLEPTIISKAVPSHRTGSGMGRLGAARSMGLFSGNLIMGILYFFSSEYSYTYAFLVAMIAGMVVLISGRGYHRLTSSSPG